MNYKKKDSGASETKNGKSDLLDKPPVKNGKKSGVGNKLSNGIKLKETKSGNNGNEEKSFLNSREFLRFLSEMRNGNFSVRLPVEHMGLDGKICDTMNEIISLNEALMLELTKAGNIIGRQGNLTHRIMLPRIAGGQWSDGVDSINELISNLVHPTIEIAHVISSVAKGNLSQEMPLQIGTINYRVNFCE